MLGRIFLNRYETVRVLGEGGMGRVYLAKQNDLGRQVVIKVMHEQVAKDPKFRERFQRETLLMARFQHPYVVTLYDASLNDPEGPCIVMEYIKGVSLDTLLHRNGRLSPTRIARLLGQLCEALQAAHDLGIVHRDLKPANLMVVDPDTPYEKIKVMDFGLAKLSDNHTMSLHKISDTGADFAVGTPGYISPEQVRGDELDHRADLYSLGVILYELLTGRLPFTGNETMEVLLAHATEAPPAFADIGATEYVSPAVEAVVQNCLAKQPAERPATARELAQRFETALALASVAPEAPADTPEVVDEGPEAVPANGTLAYDPNLVVHQLEAWMPETIAAYKLRGFVQDVGGEVIESVPGMIRVRLGGRGSTYRIAGSGPLGWLGLGKRAGIIEMELLMERTGQAQQSNVNITVVMRSPLDGAGLNPTWRARCNEVFCDLRAYLMGNAGTLTESVH